jgi:hypothetical protein
MVLADLGADVDRGERLAGRSLQLGAPGSTDAVLLGRRSGAADLKPEAGKALARPAATSTTSAFLRPARHRPGGRATTAATEPHG